MAVYGGFALVLMVDGVLCVGKSRGCVECLRTAQVSGSPRLSAAVYRNGQCG